MLGNGEIRGSGFAQMVQAGLGHQAEMSLLFAGRRVSCLSFETDPNNNRDVKIVGTPGGNELVDVTRGQMVEFLILMMISCTR